MLANSDLPERRASARSSPVVHDVALRATALGTDPKPFDLGIPDHRLPALRPGSQSVNRTLRDLVPHPGLSLGIMLGITIGITRKEVPRNLRQPNMSCSRELERSWNGAEPARTL